MYKMFFMVCKKHILYIKIEFAISHIYHRNVQICGKCCK